MQAASLNACSSAALPPLPLARLGADIPVRLEELQCGGRLFRLILPDAAAGDPRLVFEPACIAQLQRAGGAGRAAASRGTSARLNCYRQCACWAWPQQRVHTPTDAFGLPALHPGTMPACNCVRVPGVGPNGTPARTPPAAPRNAVTRMYAAAGLADRDAHWCHVWPSALALAAELLQQPDLVAGRRCCELGCGLGLAGLAAALAGDISQWCCQPRGWECLRRGRPAGCTAAFNDGRAGANSAELMHWRLHDLSMV